MYGNNKVGIVLTIAGSDNSGGAGIQADIKTAHAFGVYSASAITAVTAQNSFGVKRIDEMSADMIRTQIETILEVMHPNAVKIGMLPSADSVRTVADCISNLTDIPVIVDPVLISSSGYSLSGKTDETLAAMKELLFPIATLLTPNISEALKIIGIESYTDMESLARKCYDEAKPKSILLTGGHSEDDTCIDILYNDSTLKRYKQEKIKTANTHGTGCVLSTAIACVLARGFSLEKAIGIAKDFVSAAIQGGVDNNFVTGNGPLALMREF